MLRIKKSGFTIIETLVAIAILMIAIAGPLTIAHKGLLAAVYAHDQVTASYLAQDAMEYIKEVKNNNLLQGKADWLQDLSTVSCISDSNYCKVDTLNGNPAVAGQGNGITVCTLSDKSCLLYNGADGYSHNTGGAETQFKRYFYIAHSVNSDQATVFVKVKWRNGTVDNEVTYQTEMFNTIL